MKSQKYRIMVKKTNINDQIRKLNFFPSEISLDEFKKNLIHNYNFLDYFKSVSKDFGYTSLSDMILTGYLLRQIFKIPYRATPKLDFDEVDKTFISIYLPRSIMYGQKTDWNEILQDLVVAKEEILRDVNRECVISKTIKNQGFSRFFSHQSKSGLKTRRYSLFVARAWSYHDYFHIPFISEELAQIRRSSVETSRLKIRSNL